MGKYSSLRYFWILLAVFTAGVGMYEVDANSYPESWSGAVQADLEPESLGGVGECGGPQSYPVSAEFEQQVVELVNQERQGLGLAPLKMTDLLNSSARYHSADMVLDGYFEHDSYDQIAGSLSWVCPWYQRITSYYSGWTTLGENIALGQTTPTEVVEDWMDSPSHRENILNAAYAEIGVGYYLGGMQVPYWVQDFGRREGYYPLVINGEAPGTGSHLVRVYIYGDWKQMRLRNNDGDWTAWMPFEREFDWELAYGLGEQSISAELINSGSSASASDTIILNQDNRAVLSGLPVSINYVLTTPDGMVFPSQFLLTPANLNQDVRLTWTVSEASDWFIVSPTNGSTPDYFLIHLNENTAGFTAGVYADTFIVAAIDPEGTEQSPQTVTVNLVVVDYVVQSLFIPFVSR
jgi:hypothetical protein